METNRNSAFRGLATVSFYADDLQQAKHWYSQLLGIEPYYAFPNPDKPAYIEFRIGDYEHELGIISRAYQPPLAQPGPGGAVVFWYVDDLQAAFDTLLRMGAQAYEPITPREDGFVTASVIDPFGNVLGIMTNPHYLHILQLRQGAQT